MKGALRLFYPPQCLCCGEGVTEDGALCPACWREARFITGLCCDRCGAPLPDDGTGLGPSPEIHCDDCLAEPPPWRQGRAVMVYGGTGRSLVLALKHADRADLAPALAAWLSRAAAPLVRPGTVVVPVPIHWRRLIRRKYNQSELLAAHLARARGLHHMPDLLHRARPTAPQDHKSPEERRDNLADAIAISARRAAAVRGRPVLLVDDVMTSGATLAAAATALREAGAGAVSVAVLARAVKSD